MGGNIFMTKKELIALLTTAPENVQFAFISPTGLPKPVQSAEMVTVRGEIFLHFKECERC
jgi:hypothetical protein